MTASNVNLYGLRQCHDLHSLPDDQLARLSAQGHTVNKARSDFIWQTGDAVREVYVMLRGTAHVQMCAPDGNLILTGLIVPGQLFGEAEVFSREATRFNHVMSAEKCTLLVIPVALFNDQVELYPDYALHWLRTSNKKFVTSLRQMYSLRAGNGAARLARTILLIHHWLGPEQGDYMAFSQETIGQYAGLSRQVVNRVLSDWRQRHLIDTGYGVLRILNVAALILVAEA
ncbi:MAG: Crp/Fnr family transcriptional regulator [Alcanivoracaceae bacterium]